MTTQLYPNERESTELLSPNIESRFHPLKNVPKTGPGSDEVNRITRRKIAFLLPVGLIAGAVALNPSKSEEIAKVAYDTTANWGKDAYFAASDWMKREPESIKFKKVKIANIDKGIDYKGPIFDKCTPYPEVCNHLDDNCNGLVDDGLDCSHLIGPESGALKCSNGVDDDGDSDIDCADADCAPFCTVAETTAVSCSDGFDGDADGLVDCADPDCAVFCTGVE
jgi:hypothetical protein